MTMQLTPDLASPLTTARTPTTFRSPPPACSR